MPALDFSVFLHADAWVSLATLTALEIVLGIDNIVFITILTGRLPERAQPAARTLGLTVALVARICLLLAITWVMGLKKVLFTIPILDRPMSGRDLILVGGGLFLVAKAVHEMFDRLEAEPAGAGRGAGASFLMTIVQIGLLDIVFSLDSVITAVGMARELAVMVAAVLIAVVVMLVFVGVIARFITRHPSVRVLALSFLLLVGVMLLADGMGQHIDRGYIYFAMIFALGVELVNMRARRAEPLALRQRYEHGGTPPAPGA